MRSFAAVGILCFASAASGTAPTVETRSLRVTIEEKMILIERWPLANGTDPIGIKKSIPRIEFQKRMVDSLRLYHWHFENKSEDQRFQLARPEKGIESMSVAKAVKRRFANQMKSLDETLDFFKRQCEKSCEGELAGAVKTLRDLRGRFNASREGQAALVETNRILADAVTSFLKNPRVLTIDFFKAPPYRILESELRPLPEIKFLKVLGLKPIVEIAETGVTQEQWYEVMGTNPSFFATQESCPGDYFETDGVGICRGYPVENLSRDLWEDYFQRWNEAQSKFLYRLPRDTERERAARSGSKAEESERELTERAWFLANSNLHTQKVGTKKPNAWGFYDLRGGLWEVIENTKDVLKPNTYSITGGSWFDPAAELRVGRVHQLPSDWVCYDVGLRMARTERSVRKRSL